MLKIPKGAKYKKYHKGRLKNIVSKNYTLKNCIPNGCVSLRALESCRITPNHLSTLQLLLTRNLKKSCQMRFPIFPHVPITKKPLEVRMGKGKGSVDSWVFNAFTGVRLLDLEGNNKKLLAKNLKALQKKLPIKTKIIYEF